MSYWYCYYHVVWATERRLPFLEAQIETAVHAWIRDKSALLHSEVVAVNGTDDHVHIAVSIPPKLAVADWARQVKGYTAYHVNSHFRAQADLFRWQGGYGVITVGPKHLPIVIDYINHQKEHHASKTIISALEEIGVDEG